MKAPHIERMITEASDLGDKIGKLRAFRDNSPLYAELPENKRTLLAAQLQAMSCYASILAIRLGLEIEEEAA